MKCRKEKIRKQIGGRLQEARENLGYKPGEFADILGISESNYRKYESGKICFATDHLAILSEYTGLDSAYVINGRRTDQEIASRIIVNSNSEQRKEIIEYVYTKMKEIL